MQFRSLLIAAALVASTSAMAAKTQYQAVIRAQLDAVGSDEYISADLFMDGRKGLLELTVQEKMPACAEGMMCIQVMPEPQTYTLEGATSSVDQCGVITTSAQVDNRPSDGAFLSITVRHNQNNTCPTFVALKAIEVHFERKWYSRLNAREEVRSATFASDNVALINPGNKGGDVEFTGEIGKISYADKVLTLDLTYGGGCEEHAFDLKFGECKKVKVFNSTIDECEVTVLHTQGAGDRCRAMITKKHKIDLSGLAQAYIVKIGDKKVLVH
ncbi:MAG: hypothetical protein V4655_03040 [Bdellovibrionota bacterium]